MSPVTSSAFSDAFFASTSTSAGHWRLKSGQAIRLLPKESAVLRVRGPGGEDTGDHPHALAWLTVQRKGQACADEFLPAGATVVLEPGDDAVLEPLGPHGLWFSVDALPQTSTARTQASDGLPLVPGGRASSQPASQPIGPVSPSSLPGCEGRRPGPASPKAPWLQGFPWPRWAPSSSSFAWVAGRFAGHR